jgi:hypothetical protein
MNNDADLTTGRHRGEGVGSAGVLEPLGLLDLSAHPPDRRVLIGIGVAAMLTDLAVRSGVAVVGGTLLVLAVVVAMLGSGRVVNRDARVLATTAGVFGLFLSWRQSDWLLPLDVLAVAGLLVLSASFARGGRVAELTIGSALSRTVAAGFHGLLAPAFVLQPLGGAWTRWRRVDIVEGDNAAAVDDIGVDDRPAPVWVGVVRGLGIGAPIAFLVATLLTSADAVFASAFRISLDPVSLFAHGGLLGLGAWGMGGLARVASARQTPAGPETRVRLGEVEGLTILGVLVAVYAAFAVSQLVVLTGGADHVLQTAGLTYAEYARDGFFQLLAAAGLTLVTLLGSWAAIEPSGSRRHRRLTVLAEIAVALTVASVGVALRRLHLYEHAFGLTMLRLYSSLFALWLGAVFLLLGAWLARPRARHGLLPAAVGLGLAMLLALNLVNPEAQLVKRNAARAEVDLAYLATLSDDAVPALAKVLPRLPEPARTAALERLCSSGPKTAPGGWAGWNHSARKAAAVRHQLCP